MGGGKDPFGLETSGAHMKKHPSSSATNPRVSVSSTTTLANKTGSWKYIRPVYRDKVAPCNATCPVGIDIEGYINLLREGNTEAAMDLLLQENPLPAITGRVCDHPCETACNRRPFDEAVAVHALERMLGDRILGGDPPKPAKKKVKARVAVIGSGPAGLACAYHAARMGYGVTVFEAEAELGGMLRLGIPEFRLPRSVLDRQIEWLGELGIEFKANTRIGTDLPWNELDGFDAVFTAPGAHRGKPVEIENVQEGDVRSGLEFLKDVNRGERPDLGRNVIVIGGGNTAIDCARASIRLGAEPVIVYRRTELEMPAIQAEIEEAKQEGVRFRFLAAPHAVHHESEKLVRLTCKTMKLGEPDESGRRRPIPTTGLDFDLPADTILTAVGEDSELDFVSEELEVDGALIPVSYFGQTKTANHFAGGDVVDQPRTVAHALGSGKRAAIGIDRFIRARNNEDLPSTNGDTARFATGNVSAAAWLTTDPVKRTDPQNRIVQFEEINLRHFTHRTRNDDQQLDIGKSVLGFDEINRGLRVTDAMDEARRCFNCGVCNECDLCLLLCPDMAISRRPEGRFDIDMQYCKGCGICAVECPRGAIEMTREGL